MSRRQKTSPKKIEREERARKALALRRAGLDYDRIAQETGYANRSGAYKAVAGLLAERVKASESVADGVIDLELERLDVMLVGIWDKARRGDLHAVDRVIRIGERRAKLLGIDSPERREISGPEGGEIQVRSAMIWIPPESDD